MITEEATYIVVRFQGGYIECAGTHLYRKCADMQATSLNERLKQTLEADWQVTEASLQLWSREPIAYAINADYFDYARLIDMNKADLMQEAGRRGLAQSGTKNDIVIRILRG